MKSTIRTTVVTVLCVFLFAAAARAQSSRPTVVPAAVGKKAPDGSSQEKGRLQPAYLAAGGYILPKEYVEAQQKHPTRPGTRLVTEAEKRRILQAELNKYKALAHARHSGAN